MARSLVAIPLVKIDDAGADELRQVDRPVLLELVLDDRSHPVGALDRTAGVLLERRGDRGENRQEEDARVVLEEATKLARPEDFDYLALVGNGYSYIRRYAPAFLDAFRAGDDIHRRTAAEVFGVRQCDGQDYRLVSNHLYRILEAKALYIYGVQRPVSQGKGFRVVPAYYFSSGARGELLPLTLDNLHRVYASNHRFIDSLDRVWEREIAEYDTYHQQFKVGRLLAESGTEQR